MIGAGCSRPEPEEKPPSAKDLKVVKRIERPVAEPVKAIPGADGEMTAEPGAGPDEAKPSPPEVEAVPGTASEEEPAEKDMLEEKALPLEQAAVPSELQEPVEESPVEDKPSAYVVEMGDSLSSIAEKERTYASPLKWILIYRLNLDKLGGLQTTHDLPLQTLPEGMKLDLVGPDEVKENLKKWAGRRWVVNVVSETTNSKVVPVALTLVKKGYPTYITKVTVKGEPWMRVRVGFFKNMAEAEKEGKKVMGELDLTDAWVTKISEQELEEFGGYL
jgi:hypothetical protein